MTLPAFWLPLLVAHTTAIPPDAPAQREAAQFASAASQLADQGYQLRDLQTRVALEGIEFAIVLADDRSAQSLSVYYNHDTENFSRYTQHAVAMPTEERHYLHGEELLEELSLSAPQRIDFECADYYLDFGLRSVSLAEHAFETELRKTAQRPERALSRWLRALLADGELVDIRDESYDNGATVAPEVVFVVDGSEGVQELRATIDGRGRVQEVRLLHSPATPIYKRYEQGQKLREALRRPIASINFAFSDAEDAGELEAIELDLQFAGEVKNAKSFRIRSGDFAEAGAGGCGC